MNDVLDRGGDPPWRGVISGVVPAHGKALGVFAAVYAAKVLNYGKTAILLQSTAMLLDW